MTTHQLYKDVLLDHYRHPRNKGNLDGARVVGRGSNPRCGDEIEVGLFSHGNMLDRVQFRGRGCSICIAAASMMSEALSGRSKTEAAQLSVVMHRWFGNGNGAKVEPTPPALEALSAVREYPARRKCVMLCWEALSEALFALDQTLRPL